MRDEERSEEVRIGTRVEEKRGQRKRGLRRKETQKEREGVERIADGGGCNPAHFV